MADARSIMDILQELDRLKARVDTLRPLDPDLLENLREVYTVRLTYNSNAIEGNTLTESETQIVLEKGITIGGKPLRHHLEAIDHAAAIAPSTSKPSSLGKPATPNPCNSLSPTASKPPPSKSSA